MPHFNEYADAPDLALADLPTPDMIPPDMTPSGLVAHANATVPEYADTSFADTGFLDAPGTVGLVGAPGQAGALQPSLLLNLEAGTAYTPQQLAQARSAAKILGRSEKLVLDTLPASLREVQAKRIEQNEWFAGWAAQSPKNAALAADDIDGLGGVFEVVSTLPKSYQADSIQAHRPGFVESIPELAREGLDSAGMSMLGLTMLATDQASAWAQNQGFENLASSAQEFSAGQRQTRQDYLRTTSAPLQFEEGSPAQWGADFIRTAVPVVTMQAPVALATGGLGGMLFMGGQIAGGKYLDLTEAGVSHERAAAASLMDAALQAPLERIGLGSLMKIGKATGVTNIIKQSIISGFSEAGTEFLQKYPEAATEIWALAEKQGMSLSDASQAFFDQLGTITKEGLYEGSLALPLGGLGGFGRGAHLASSRQAQQFVDLQTRLHTSVDAANLKRLSPGMMQEMLEENGVTQSAYIPAEAALAMTRSNPAYADAFGLTQEQLTEAAAMGQDIEVPTAAIAARLDAEQFAQVKDVMRATPSSLNLAESADQNARLAQDSETITQLHQEQQTLRQEMDTARANVRSALYELPGFSEHMTRLRAEATAALQAVPGLEAQAETTDGAGGGLDGESTHGAQAESTGNIDTAVDAWLDTLEGYSLRWAAAGRNPAEVLQKIVFADAGVVGPRQTYAQAAMLRAEDADIVDFVHRVTTTAEDKKTYFEMNPEQGVLGGVSVRLPADSIRHKNKRHPDMTDEDMSRLPQILDMLTSEHVAPARHNKPRFGGKAMMAKAVVDGQPYGLILESVRPDRVVVSTYFKDTARNIDAWFDQNADKGKAVTTPAALWLAQASHAREDAFRDQPSAPNLMSDGQAVNATEDEQQSGARENIDSADQSPNDQGQSQELFHPSIEDIVLADEALRRDTQAWAETVDAFLGGTLSERHPVTMLRQTPLVLQMLGAKNLPVRTSYKVLNKVIVGKHKITPELVKQIPAAMADPIMIFKTTSGDAISDVTMMLELKDVHGATIVVPVALEQKGSTGYTLNVVPSMYVKNYEDTGASRNQWFSDQISEGNLLYQNAKKSRDWMRSSRRQLPGVGALYRGKYKIYTEDDLVKLRQANPTMYQAASLVDAETADTWRDNAKNEYSNPPADEAQVLFHPSIEDIVLADEALRQDTQAWTEIVAKFVQNRVKPETADKAVPGKPKEDRPITMLRQTPLVLQMLGAKNRRLNATLHLLQDGLFGDNHQLPEDVMKQLPAAMADPIMVFKSATEGGDLVMMLELKDRHGGTVIVPVALEQTSTQGYTINLATSVYGKTKRETRKPNNGWFATQIQDGNLLYQNKKKRRDWMRAVGLQLLATGSHLSTSAKRKIFTEEDLVKLRQANPTMYQAASHDSQHSFQHENLSPEESAAAGREAMDNVIGGKTDVLDAMFRPEVGSISFYWGTPGAGKNFRGGSGVSHLIAKRNAEGLDGEVIARTMPEVIAHGQAGPVYGPVGGERINISHNGHTAVLSLYRMGNLETWLLTGWEEAPVGAVGAVNAPDATHSAPSGIRTGMGATDAENNIKPLGADGKPLFHGVESGSPRGSVTITPESYLISLFDNADLSTLLHETGHIFFEEMGLAVHSGIADAAMRKDYATLRNWLGAHDGKPLRVDQKERLARAFEVYLMEGKAPSRALQIAFARFKTWLGTIYAKARQRVGDDLGTGLTDEVRNVFDRMLATNMEIERTAAACELFPLTQRELDALGLEGEERAYAASLMQTAKAKASENLQLARTQNRPSRLAAWTNEARQTLLQTPVYAAKSAQAPPLDTMVQTIVQIREAVSDAATNPEPFLLETAEAARQVELVGQSIARKLGRQAVQKQAFIRVAKKHLAAIPVEKAMTTERFTAAMSRALRKERAAIAAGDFERAFEANAQAQLNLECARRSRAIGERQADVTQEAKRFVTMAEADPAARFAVNDIAARYSLMPYNAQLIKGNNDRTISNWIAEKRKEGFALTIDDAILYGHGQSWEDATVSEFENVARAISQIIAAEHGEIVKTAAALPSPSLLQNLDSQTQTARA